MTLRRFLLGYADRLGMTPGQAVELARALGRDSDVSPTYATAGLGQGVGPDATPCNVGLFLAAVLAGGPQTRASAAAQALFGQGTEFSDVASTPGIVDEDHDPWAEFADMPLCPLTCAGTFGDALVSLLGNADLASTIDVIEVRRGAPCIRIVRGDSMVSRFVDQDVARRLRQVGRSGDLAVVALIGGDLLAEIARDIAA